jgi:hypothetical protein
MLMTGSNDAIDGQLVLVAWRPATMDPTGAAIVSNDGRFMRWRLCRATARRIRQIGPAGHIWMAKAAYVGEGRCAPFRPGAGASKQVKAAVHRLHDWAWARACHAQVASLRAPMLIKRSNDRTQ